MRVLFITQFGIRGGSSRIQVLQFLPLLRERGFAVESKAVYPDAFFDVQMGVKKAGQFRKFMNLIFFAALAAFKKCAIALAARRYDVTVIQKETFPKILFSLLILLNPRVIYELDDTIFEENPYHRGGFLKTLLLRYQASLCRNMLRRAAAVVAENEYLAAEARKWNARVAVLSAPIDVGKVCPRSLPKGARGEVVIGWIGSPSTTYLLEHLAPALETLAREVTGWKLVTVGARPDFSLRGVPLLNRPWSLETEIQDLQSFDIGIMPLDDSPFNRGRLGYKMIQYMAVGIPTVAEDIGLNRTVVRDGENGLLVSGVEGWVVSLRRLLEDAPLRQTLGQSARRTAKQEFSLEEKVRIWERVLEEVGGMKVAKKGLTFVGNKG